jgi:hypothetical protein
MFSSAKPAHIFPVDQYPVRRIDLTARTKYHDFPIHLSARGENRSHLPNLQERGMKNKNTA